MRWPWQKREARASQPFTDAIVQAIATSAAARLPAIRGAIAALEAAAGLYAAAFAGRVWRDPKGRQGRSRLTWCR